MTATITTLPTPVTALHAALVARGVTVPIAAQMANCGNAVWLLTHNVTVAAVASILMGETGPID